MSNNEGFLLAIILVVSVLIVVGILWCMWLVSGFICGTFGWFTYDSWAQLYTFIVMIACCGVGVSRK